MHKFDFNISIIGWILILSSSLLLATSFFAVEKNSLSFMLLIFSARTMGIGGFLCGVCSIFQNKWNHGTLLIISSLVLPIISFIVHSSF
jgi:hypothetical protein